jgi:dienelactone hydrolase
MARVIPAIVLAIAAGACATYPSMDARSSMLAPNAEYFEPEEKSAAPLVILLSGCGGMIGSKGEPNTIMQKYAKAAARAGAYAVVVDSFRPRDIGYTSAIQTVCTGLQLRGDARAGDALAAEKLAEAHWGKSFDRVILSGWSHGAWSVMELLRAGPEAKTVGRLKVEPSATLTPQAVTLFYPYCGFLNGSGGKPWAFTGPILLGTAEKDTIGKTDECRRIVTGGRPGLAGVEDIVFAGMTHAFDEETQAGGSAFVYDPQTSAEAEALYARFIAQQVARTD